MIILTETTDKLEMNLGWTASTSQLKVFCSYRETTSTTIVGSNTNTESNNLSFVEVVGSPTSNKQRIVDYISIFNSDTTTKEVKIYFNQNGTRYILYDSVINVEEKIEYSEKYGFKTLTRIGSEKTFENINEVITDSDIKIAVLQKDYVSRNAVSTFDLLTKVDSLSFPTVLYKSYYFKFFIIYSASATTVGSRFGLIGPDSVFISYYNWYGTAATTLRSQQGIIDWSTTHVLSGTGVSTTSPATIGNTAIIEGIIRTKVTGPVSLVFSKSDSADNITILKGSYVTWEETL